MKKSTFFVLAAIVSAFTILTAGNMKLEKEYTNGHIQSRYVKKILPPFHYITETLNAGHYFTVTDSLSGENSISVVFDEIANFRFHVSSDTLFIFSAPGNTLNTGWGNPVVINVAKLKHISASNGRFTVTNNRCDSLSIDAGNRSDISISLQKTKYLDIRGEGFATINLLKLDSAGAVSVLMKYQSCFYANNTSINKKNLHIRDSASVKLSGLALADFDLKDE